MSAQEVTPVACRQCGITYQAPCQTIINVSQNPALKNQFLQGQLSSAQCPQCGTINPLTNPILYHDAEKELAYAFVPNGMQLGHINEQKLIGNLSNRLMNSLPPEQRKAYLFNPKTFLTLDSLVKAVLAADGITEDVIKAQQEKIALLKKLFEAQSEDKLKALIAENEAQLDYQFFEIITSMALQSLQDGNEEQGQNLLAFRQLLAQWSSQGQKFVAELDEKMGLQTLSPESLLNALEEAETEDEFLALVSAGKPVLDYNFFQNLTAQIESALAEGNKNRAEELKALRSKILNASAKLDDENQRLMKEAIQLLQTLFQAPNQQQAIEENLDKIDDALMSLLAANIQQADAEGNKEAAKKLTALYQNIIQIMQSHMPPEMALLNQLLQAQSPQDISSLLQQNKAMISPEFLNFMNAVEQDFNGRGQSELAAVVAEIIRQAQSIVNSS